MNKYILCFESNDNSLKKILLSDNEILKIDNFTSNFNNEVELINYFNLKEYEDYSIYIQNGLTRLPILFSKQLDYVNDFNILEHKLIEKSNDFNFLCDFLKEFNDSNIKKYVKKIYKSLKKIDIYCYDIMALSNSLRIGYCDRIFENNQKLDKKNIIIENINNEKSHIKLNLQNIFYKLVYENNKNNYLNMRNIYLFMENYDSKSEQKNIYLNKKLFLKK